LLSFKAHHVLSVYLANAEKEYHSRLGGDVVRDIKVFLSKSNASSVYVLLARDWRNLKEVAIKKAFRVDFEEAYPGVKILKITNPHYAAFRSDELALETRSFLAAEQRFTQRKFLPADPGSSRTEYLKSL
jgi:hypothetical protein